ncbi:MAG: hypothetical protein HYZ54_01045 [Ignavibacteriae bacterium]|nr:hypothetical protein [Ignavibacteriota bacterium]
MKKFEGTLIDFLKYERQAQIDANNKAIRDAENKAIRDAEIEKQRKLEAENIAHNEQIRQRSIRKIELEKNKKSKKELIGHQLKYYADIRSNIIRLTILWSICLVLYSVYKKYNPTLPDSSSPEFYSEHLIVSGFWKILWIINNIILILVIPFVAIQTIEFIVRFKKEKSFHNTIDIRKIQNEIRRIDDEIETLK